MSQSAAGGRTLPDNGNVDIGSGSNDIAAIITAMRAISKMVQTGTGAPGLTAPSTGGLYINITGTSVTTLYASPGSTTGYYPVAVTGAY
jgi:hypothetical protein